ncbi:hypothetical protein TNCV_213791 [Trichonephila clavipes]|nr:hypothetical protein TNCV_213791 [Trichonephila clavipes]
MSKSRPIVFPSHQVHGWIRAQTSPICVSSVRGWTPELFGHALRSTGDQDVLSQPPQTFQVETTCHH